MPDDVNLMDFIVDGEKIGRITPKVCERLCNTSPSIFQQVGSDYSSALTLGKSAGDTPESRTEAVATVMEELKNCGYITGWRDELYPVAPTFDRVSTPIFLIERAAASLLGVMEYGVHINGLVKSNDNKEKMWMARRAKTKSKFPGFLDHIVAGGQPAGLSLMRNVIKECEEEAGIPEELTKSGIKPTGVISYENYGGRFKEEGEGVMSRVVLFCFDLMLPSDFVPNANDGEVEEFFTWSLEEIAQSMHPKYHDPIKPNCYPVIIDYLLRSGAISPDSPKYLDIIRRLRSGQCV
jgi:isopentenyldiphosphate isomerase